VLELPQILSGVSDQFRGMLEKSLLEKNHGPALAVLDDEKEAWDTADAALRTAIDAMQTAGEFSSVHAFNLWLAKVAPPDPVATPHEKREDEVRTVESLLSGAQGLSHAAYETLSKGIGQLRSERFDREIAALGNL
jgi:hypothetical protein